MENNIKKLIVPVICIVLILTAFGAAVFHVSGNTRYFSGEAEVYYQDLIQKGFPEAYAVSLTELHLLHPTWEFAPLLVTSGNSKYTWDYVIDEETKEADNNLISSEDSQKSYRHPTNQETYDAGHYQASTAAVEYFMDPRNFLNETDIFQFYDLGATYGIDRDALEAVLSPTFMKDMLLENSMHFSDYFLQVGNALGINPLYLAVKARTEQGATGNSPVISGQCGTYLKENPPTSLSVTPAEEELLALNGLYNIYNINAKGNGLPNIYYSAMKRAQTGTERMRDAWGSPSWNTLWKSIYGGADWIKTSYIDRYQNTIYLQKFNVDSRAGEDKNFWKQYAQNVANALIESRILYSSFASIDALDSACHFLIPVYDGMPKKACADPANGSCSYLATADQKYEYALSIGEPFGKTLQNAALYATQETFSGSTLKITGNVTHSYGVVGLEYAWDGGDWTSFSNSGTINLSLSVDFSENTSHILVIRGRADYDNDDSRKKCNSYFPVSVIYVDVKMPPQARLSIVDGERTSDMTLSVGSRVLLPVNEASDFLFWHSSDDGFFRSGEEVILQSDTTYEAIYLQAEVLDGAALVLVNGAIKLRFYVAVEETLYQMLTSANTPVHFFGMLTENGEAVGETEAIPFSVQMAYGKSFRILSLDSPPLGNADYGTNMSVQCAVGVTYADGMESVLNQFAPSDVRSPRTVALAALADSGAIYEPELLACLQSIADTPNVQKGSFPS